MGLRMPSGPGGPWVPLGRQWGRCDVGGDGDGLLGLAGSPAWPCASLSLSP